MRRKTDEEYAEQLKSVAPHIIHIEPYCGSRTYILHRCLRHKMDFMNSPFNLLQKPTGCKHCQEEAMEKYYDTRRKTNDQFVAEIEALGNGIIPLDAYDGCHNKIRFKCKLGHVWPSTPHDVLDGYGCPYCSGNSVLRGFNDLWTTHPEIASMLKNKDVGYEISYGSNKKVDFVCSNCGNIKSISPKQLVSYGLGCNVCSTGISYPNKFIINLLQQCNILNLEPEWSPGWIKPYRYDSYFSLNGNEYIVEMDGGIGHGEKGYKGNDIDYDSIQRDKFKDEMAYQRGIHIIRIDCKYTDMRTRYQYVKNSVLNSELSNILDLSVVDFDLCNKVANKSLSMYAASEYDNGKSIRQISDDIGVSYDTVYSWLKRLASEGLCSYTPVVGQSRKKNI